VANWLELPVGTSPLDELELDELEEDELELAFVF
jgi:hypothetical protein